MNVTCPHCGESIQYRHELVGQPQTCLSCKKLVHLPALDKLPRALQEEYRKDLEWERKDAEAKRHKEEVRQRKETERALHQEQVEAERAMQAKQRAEEDHRKAAWDKLVQTARETTPEEAAVSNRYPALITIARVTKFFVVLAWVIWLIQLLVVAGIPRDPAAINAMIATQTFAVASLLGASIWFWTTAESIQLLVDVADDLRVNRFLLKGIRYHQQRRPEEPLPHIVSAPIGPRV